MLANNCSEQFVKISKQIDYLERLDLDSPTAIQISTWCSDQITWANKWHKISESELEILCNRMIELFGGLQ